MVFLSVSIFAQDQNQSNLPKGFFKGDQALNLSLGFLNGEAFTFGLFEANGSGEPSVALNLNYEYGVTDQISIAGFADFYRVEASAPLNINNIADQISDIDLEDLGSVFNSIECLLNPAACADETTSVSERVSVITLGGRLRYQRNFLPELDTYASTYLGYSFQRRKTITEQALDAASEELGLDIEIPTVVYYGSVGARYFITNKWAIFGEYGVGNVHLLKLGTTLKL